MHLNIRRSAAALVAAAMTTIGLTGATPAAADPAQAEEAARPNVVVFLLDDLPEKAPGGLDPLDFMPKTMQRLAQGTRYMNTSVSIPACCPSRASLMTGLVAHNSGVPVQSKGPEFKLDRSIACRLQGAGYATAMAGKFLTTWPATKLPPCFDHSTVIRGGYIDTNARVDGRSTKLVGYSTKRLGEHGREYIKRMSATGKPWFMYMTPQTPHISGDHNSLAVPEAKYAGTYNGDCRNQREIDKSDKPGYVRYYAEPREHALKVCQSMIESLKTADDEFDATMELLQSTGELANTLVVLSSDNGYLWGNHDRTHKFLPYQESLMVPFVISWLGRINAGRSQRPVSLVDLLPTILQAARIDVPAAQLDGESLLEPTRRTVTLAEYWKDPSNGGMPGWKSVTRGPWKYIATYDTAGAVAFREVYNLDRDPLEHENVLKTKSTADDVPAGVYSQLQSDLIRLSDCSGPSCLGG